MLKPECTTVLTRHNLTSKQIPKADPGLLWVWLGSDFFGVCSGLFRVCYGFTRGQLLRSALRTEV